MNKKQQKIVFDTKGLIVEQIIFKYKQLRFKSDYKFK